MADLLKNVQKEVVERNTEEQIVPDMKDIEDWLNAPNEMRHTFIMLIYGKDGTAKTGIVAHHLVKNKKRTLYLDIDGNAAGIFTTFYPDATFIRVKNPLVSKLVMVDGLPDVVIDYKRTFAKIKMALKYVADNPDKFDAVVIDGVSTLVDYAEQQMKVEKNIAADGSVQMKFWMRRNAHFLNVLEQTRAIRGVDKFFIAHDNFVEIPGVSRVKMGTEMVELQNTPAYVLKTNRMMDQRVFCELIKDDKTGEISYRATLHKVRSDMQNVNREIIFASAKPGVSAEWNGDQVDLIFGDEGNVVSDKSE